MSKPSVDIEIRFSIARDEIKDPVTDEELANLLLEDMKDEFGPEIEDGVMHISVRGISDGEIQ